MYQFIEKSMTGGVKGKKTEQSKNKKRVRNHVIKTSHLSIIIHILI